MIYLGAVSLRIQYALPAGTEVVAVNILDLSQR